MDERQRCPTCRRVIALSRLHGFARHNVSRGKVCEGSGMSLLSIILEPFGQAFYRYHAELKALVDALPEERLDETLAACEHVNQTNIGWGSHAAAKHVSWLVEYRLTRAAKDGGER